MMSEAKIFYKSPKGRLFKKRVQRELNKKVPELIRSVNHIIQKDNYCYGIYYKRLDNKIFNQLGYHLTIYFDFDNLKFYYSVYRMIDNQLLKTFTINLNINR